LSGFAGVRRAKEEEGKEKRKGVRSTKYQPSFCRTSF